MKKILFIMMAMFCFLTSSRAMSYEQARNEALFLTDKMAYELNLTDEQYEAAYEINLDYLMSVTNRDNVMGPYWEQRNMDIRFVLYPWQWEVFCAATYFYRPLYWDAGYWHFRIYVRYPHRNYFYFGRPHFYASYRGAHCWRMNGGRSYYERRYGYHRSHVSRDRHIGMRDGWNRGDYRSGRRGISSTRVTGLKGSEFRKTGRRNSDVTTSVNTNRARIADRQKTDRMRNRSSRIAENRSMTKSERRSANAIGSRSASAIGSRSASAIGSRSASAIGSRSASAIGSRSASVIGSRSASISGSRSASISGSRSGSFSNSRSASISRNGGSSSRAGGARSSSRHR